MFENWNRLVRDVKNGKFKTSVAKEENKLKQQQEDNKEKNEEKEN